MKQPYVSTLIEQDFSDEEKALARDNIAALSSADLGPYATRDWVSDNFLSDGDFREFATHEEVYSATSGKMDSTEASAFYPRYSNPEGYLTIIPSEYVTDTEMSSYVAQETSAFLTSGDLSGYATEQWVLDKNYITSADVPPQIEYSAGQNVNINNHVISATDTTYSAGSGLALNGTTFVNTAPNVKSDWNAAAGSNAEILNKPTIPTKTSELNNDSGFITSASIPTVNNGTLTIQRNGTQVATFSANQSGNATANISVPTDTSDLTNGAGFITSASIPTANNGKLTVNQGPYLLGEFTANQSGNTTIDVERYQMPSGIALDVTTAGNSNTHETTFMADVLYSTGLRITSDNELAVKMKAGGHVSADSDGIYVPKVVLHDTFGAYPVAYSYATETPVSIIGGTATLTLAYSAATPGSSSNWSPVTFYLTLTDTSQMFYVTSKLYDETQIGVVLTGSGASPNGNKTNLTTLMTGTGPSLSSSDNSERVELDIYILSNASYLEPLRHAHVTINRVYQTPSGAGGTGPLIFVNCEYEDTI